MAARKRPIFLFSVFAARAAAAFVRTRPKGPIVRITQAFTFEAAHRLPHVPQTHKCFRMHGHSYRVELVLDGPVDAHTGFVADFFDVEAAFAPLLERLDHHCLNDIEGLSNPTAEHIALWIWERAKPLLAPLALVRVFETPMSWAEYGGA
jgi:6-pyruvoyltetrahydropterin/6-carboxytetrahydropterin synthase